MGSKRRWNNGGVLSEIRSYNQYINSDLWQGIRHRVFRERGTKCWCCNGTAHHIHHASYNEETLTGSSLENLYPVCERCHAEMHKGARLSEANLRMHDMHEALKAGYRSPYKARVYKPKKSKSRRKRRQRPMAEGKRIAIVNDLLANPRF